MVAYYIIVSTFPCVWDFWWNQILFLMAGLLTLESKEDKRILSIITASQRSCPASQGNEECGNTRGNFLGALVPVTSGTGAWNRTACMSNMAGEYLHQPVCRKHLWLLISIHFSPRLFGDHGHGPILDDRLQIIVIINWKKNKRMRTQEPSRRWGWGAGTLLTGCS